MIRAIEIQKPLWEPSTSGCYHTFTMGYLAGELVRRVRGRTVGQFLQEEICRSLHLDYHFGLSATDQRCCAEIHEAPDGFFMNLIRDTNTLLGKRWVPLPLRDHQEDFNSAQYRTAEMPSFNGHGTTRSVARLFGALACGGVLDGVRLLSEQTTAYGHREAWHQTDVFGIPSRMSNGGFMLCNDAFTKYNSNPRSFGHIGLGGAVAFGDPDAKLGFSFCGNRMAPIADLGPYAKRMLHATQLSL